MMFCNYRGLILSAATRIGTIKVGKLRDWDADSLMGRAKATHISKAKEGIDSRLPMNRQVFSHLQRGLHRSNGDLRRQPPNNISLQIFVPSSFFSQLCIPSMSHGLEYPFSQSVSPASLPCAHNFLTSLSVQKAGKTLPLCKPCSAIAKTSLY